MQAGHRGVAPGGVELAFLHQVVEPLLDVLNTAVDELVVDFPEGDLIAATDGGLRDPRPHQARAGDIQLLHRHAFSLNTSRAITNRWISFVPS